MSQFSFRFPRAYRLRAAAEREEDALSLLTVGANNRHVIVPYSAGLDYVLVPNGGVALSAKSSDFRVETLGPLSSLWARLRLAFLFRKRKYLKYEEFSLFSVGPRAERRLYEV